MSELKTPETLNNADECMRERAALSANINAIVNKPDYNGEDKQEVDRMFTRCDELKEMADKFIIRSKADKLAAEMTQSQGVRTAEAQATNLRSSFTNRSFDRDDRNTALRAWALNGSMCNASQMQRANEMGVNPFSNELNLRTLSVGGASLGATLVQTSVGNEIEKKLKYFGAFRDWVRQYPTEDIAPLTWPQFDNVSNLAAVYSEAASLAADDSTDPSIPSTRPTLTPKRISTPVITVTYEELASSKFDIEQLIVSALVEQIMREEEALWATGSGNGANGVQGINQSVSNGVTIANSTSNALTAAHFVNLVYSVDRAYRSSDKCAFVMNDVTYAQVRQIGSSLMYSFLTPSLQAGEPDKLLGYPVRISNSLPAWSATGFNSQIVYFGDFSRYVWRNQTNGMKMIKLVENYASVGEVGFLMYDFATGCYVCQSNATAVMALKTAAS